MAVETRKIQLVDIALDCLQKLISHKHLQGPVHNINHRREAATKGRRRPTDDDEDGDHAMIDNLPPQVNVNHFC